MRTGRASVWQARQLTPPPPRWNGARNYAALLFLIALVLAVSVVATPGSGIDGRGLLAVFLVLVGVPIAADLGRTR